MPTDGSTTIKDLREAALAFRDERDWAQFHEPKDLALALGIEAGELGELFLWKTGAEIATFDAEALERVSDELADVLIYLLFLGDSLDIDLAQAVAAKLAKNERKYPAEKARGSAAKWSELLDSD